MSLSDAVRSIVRAATVPTDDAFRAPQAAVAESAQRLSALADAARDRLRRAHAERRRAAAALTEADERVARAEIVIDDAERAEREAAEAEAAARIASRDWVSAGCPDDSRPDQGLLDRAAKSADRAIDARTLAEGARAALPGLAAAAAEARAALGAADDALRSAAVAVLAAHVEPRLSELERLRDAYETALRPVASLRYLVRGWGPAHPLHGFASGVGAEIDARLRELAIEQPAEPDIVGGAHDLFAVARRLMEDPEAKV